MRRLVSSAAPFFLFALGLFVLSGGPAAATQNAQPKILRIWWADGVPDDFEPQTNDSGISDLILLNYEGLTRFDEELNVVPGAAESWEFSDDGLTMTFHLRDNLVYSDGSPLTAERFRYAIERRCDPGLTSSGAEEMFDIAGCEELNATAVGGAEREAAKASLGVRAPDDRTLEIDLRRPAPYFLALTQWVGFVPVKQEIVEAGTPPDMWLDPANWVGNGPFRVTAIELDATPPRVTLARNDRYWGGQAKLDGIEYVVMDFDDAQAAYMRGELDITVPDFDTFPALEADPVLSRELLELRSPLVGLFHFNLTREPFQDKKVREAFAHAFDREAYCRDIHRETCTPQANWMPPGVPGAIESDAAYPYDPLKAREALAASTYGGPENLPEIVFNYIVWGDADSDEWERQHAAWVADQFRQVLGVELTLTPVSLDEIEAMSDNAATRPQLIDSSWWADLADPHGWMMYWTCGHESFAEDVGYCNPEYDALVERADSELDPAERIRLAEESQRVLMADVPAIFGYSWDDILLVKPYVTGYSPTAPGQAWPGWWTPLTVDIVPTD